MEPTPLFVYFKNMFNWSKGCFASRCQIHQRAFTVVELMLVISIMSVLSSVVIASTGSAKGKGRDAFRVAQISEVKKALELYYDTYGYYPVNSAVAGGTLQAMPWRWQSMVRALNNDDLIEATFTKFFDKHFSLVKVAYAVGGPPIGSYAPCSIQDPLYKVAEDYGKSFMYSVAADGQSYKIRILPENAGSQASQNSLTGKFLNDTTTGNMACDTGLGYLCVGGGNLATFQPVIYTW